VFVFKVLEWKKSREEPTCAYLTASEGLSP